GQDTVAIRVPSDRVGHDILRRAGIGVIAPSANRFGAVSATRAEHVVADFGDAVDLIVDGGPTTVGIESTIVSLVSGEPAILRPGGITREQLEEALRAPVRMGGTEIRVPGSMPSHYAPLARVELFDELESAKERVRALETSGERVELLAPELGVEAFARELYERLREADARSAQTIVIVAPPEGGIGTAIRDRLKRMSSRA
ncbi:MAG: L-threonylcarbamoyladenylate synthase, partial [Vulcanimicrobiaceae bacterium]